MDERVTVLEEPTLLFRYGQRVADPRDGLALFGPCDIDDHAAHPKSLAYGVVGPPEGIEHFRAWSQAMNRPSTQAPKDNLRLWPPFPGFDAAFASTWYPEPTWKHAINRSRLLDVSRRHDPHERAYEVVNLYVEALEAVAKLDRPVSVLVCVVPDEVYANCRPESVVLAKNATGERTSPEIRASRRRGQGELFVPHAHEPYELSSDFRRQLKARIMQHRVPVQIIRESTLRLSDDVQFGERRLTPLSNRMWNLATAFYYKGGGQPWRLATARDGVCYLGIAFKRADKGSSRTACCAAQMFLDSGDGIVFLGEYGPWYSPETKQFRLTREAASKLLAGALATYSKLHGKPLREVFLHAHSDISHDEFAGYRDACPANTHLVGVRVRTERLGPRLFREGKMPVMRGTFWQRAPRRGFLWASGFKPRIATYDGAETPAPLQIDIQHGDAELDQVARDIFGLTKLNYNACNLGDGEPVTIRFSEAVGEILVSNPKTVRPEHRFRFYI